MSVLLIFILCLMTGSRCLDTKHNCSFVNELFWKVGNFADYPRPGDRPMLNRKIVEGTRVTIHEHPYIASIRRRRTHYLVGTLIGYRLVMTVAHSIINVPIVELSVSMGQNYNDRGTKLLTVVLLIIPKDFDRHTLRSDLALIRIYENIDYKPTVRPIRSLLDKSFKFDNKPINAVVTGWGRCDLTGKELCLPRASIYYRDEYADPMLRSINIQISEKTEQCAQYESHETPVGENMLCVGPARQEQHTCPCLAVPGAPLAVGGDLLGVLSWGFGCGYHTDLPLVYTDIRAYYNWTKDIQKIFAKLDWKDEINNTDFLKQLYEITRLAISYEWLSSSRATDFLRDYPKAEIKALKVDRDLALINGYVYDIRDYYGGKNYIHSKMRNMEKLRIMIVEERQNLMNVTMQEVTTDPQRVKWEEKQWIATHRTYLDHEYQYEDMERRPHANTNNSKPSSDHEHLSNTVYYEYDV